MLKGNNEKLRQDLSILAVSLFFAVLLWHNNAIDYFLISVGETSLLSAFVAGLFFSSAFTTIPAVAFLAKIAQFNSPLTIAFLGGAGALIADSVLFYFIRDRLVSDFMETIRKPRLKRIEHLLKSKIIRFSAGLIGGVLLALPLPTDETAFTIMGLSRMKTYTFLLIAFSFNFAAIYLMASAAAYLTS